MEVTESQKQEVMSFLLQNAKEASDLFKEEAPKVFQEIVTYGIMTSSFGVVVSIIALIVAIVGAAKVYYTVEKSKDRYLNDAEAITTAVVGVISIIAGISGVIGILVNTSLLLTALYAPRVYVIQFLS